ncbi:MULTISPECIES: hypothetical protein [Shewanella]|uniref:hypothetical protein n=1 Tax=Shewanella TaxID=22 RepID=UPI000B49B570|nr:hypothetical protein [Shewanella sp. Shew256]
MSLQQIFKTVPSNVIPKTNSKSYRLLALLANGEVANVELICYEVGINCRSPLQQLMGKRYGFWNIIPVCDDKGLIVGRKLDPRHLSEEPKLDARARAERRVELARESLGQSIHEKARVRKARAELSEAEEHLLSLESENK